MTRRKKTKKDFPERLVSILEANQVERKKIEERFLI